ncbi:MAG: DUF2183 domain-containing protein [Bdellovibrionaceae bacterium]|nr:DUF2183 domain-containing protein [Pseudobdellovibrionaceae bacterium]
MKSKIALLIGMLVLSAATSAAAKTVLISDVDDTVKLAYAFGSAYGAQYFKDTKSRFTGMSEVYDLITHDNLDVKVYYVSLAPTYLMERLHGKFLRNGAFPIGTYIGRTNLPSETHKLETIRSILRSERPSRVILVGDDGQADAAVYRQVSAEPEFAGIIFDQFIHIVSSLKEANGQNKVQGAQVGFVTSYEFALELNARKLIQDRSMKYVSDHILPEILIEAPGSDENEETNQVAFPYFMDCKAINWRWNVPGLNEKVRGFCKF